MRKFDSLKSITQGVKGFVAMLLITVMAVGNVFADEVTYVFANEGFTNAQELGSGTINDMIAYTTAQNAASNPAKFYTSGSAARFYGGNGNGNSMTLIPSGVVITALEITATSSYAPQIKYVVDEGAAETATATNNVYTISGISAISSLQFINAASGTSQLRVSQIKVTYSVGAPVVMAPTFSVAAGNYYDPFTVTLTSRTQGAAIYYTTDGTTPTTASTLYAAPIEVSATTTVKAIAVNGSESSSVAAATYNFPVQFATIADFKANAQSNVVGKITGDLTFVYRSGRYMFVQDATGGLLIYDYSNPIITTNYEEGDVISGGIYGTISIYNGLTELVPTRNTAAATVNNGLVSPVEATAANLLANYNTYESRLVKITGTTFTSNTAFYQAGADEMSIYNRFNTVTSTRNAGDIVDVIGFLSAYNASSQIYPRDNYDLVPAIVNLPYTENFDGRTNSWTLNNGNATNKWYVGKAQGFDNAKLFISNNGSTNKYENVASTATASVDVNIPVAGATLSFDYRVNGEANKDYLKVELTNGVNTVELAKLSGSNEWNDVTYDIAPAFAGTCTLTFTWVNDGATANQFPAAIDNVTITAAPCAQPTALNATVSGTTANVAWTPGAGQTAWIFEYKLADNSEWYTVNTTTASVTLNDLQGNSVYDMRVRANCGDNQSPWIYGTFAVECQSLVTSVVDQIVGTGTSNSYYSPFNNYYKNSWNQCIYTADEVGSAGNIYAIAWNCVNAASMTFTDVKIYMGTTTHSAHTSTSDWVPESELTLVYSADAPTVGASTGWENYNLQTPFYYNGTDNLVVVVAKKAGSYSSTLKYAYTDKTNRCLYRQNDGSTEYAYHPGSNTGTLGGYLANIKLHMDASVCGDAIQCPAPTDVVVSNVTTTTADVAWTAGADENAWVVEYKTAEEATWNMADATATNYVLTNLTPNADYMVRVKAVCGNNNHSNLAVANFTTVANCVVPSNIASRNETNNTVLYWTANNNETAWVFEYKASGETAWNTINVTNEPIITLSNLDNMTAYDVRVKAVCSATEESEWVNYNFVSGCAAYQLPYNESFEDYAVNTSTPDCWTLLNNDPAGYPIAYVNNSSSYVHNGSKSLYFKSSSTTPIYAVMPYFEANAVTVSFWYRNEGTNANNGILSLGTMTNPADASTFTAIRSYERMTSMTEIVENIQNLNGAYIAFRYEGGSSNNYYLGIDDINVDVIASCFVPSNFAYNNPTTNSVNLTWNPMGEENAWQVEYGVAGFEHGTGTVVTTTEAALSLHELTAHTTYDVYVRAKCGNNAFSDWSNAITFTTFACSEADKCTFNISMTDSYGDGWNGAAINAYVDGEFYGSYTISSGNSNTGEVSICDAEVLTFTWTGGSFDAECSFVISKGGETAYSGSGAQSGTFFTQNGCSLNNETPIEPPVIDNDCVKNLPYVENFESYTASTSISTFSTTPDCWDIIYSGSSTGYKPHVYNGTSYNPTGSKTLIFTSGSASYGNNAYAILPAFTTDLNSTEVSFKYRMESTTYGTLYLGYVTNADDGNSFVVLETMVSKTTGTQFETSLVGRNIPAGARLAFRWTHTSSYYSCAIDDIEVLQAATCQKPSITSVVATTNTATVTIGASATPAIGYEVVYGTPGFDVESATPVAVDANNTVVLTGLQHSTGYVVYARAICSDEDMSYWSNAYAFQTECGPASLPYTENFDGVVSTTTISTSVFPACWSSYFSGTSTSYGNSVYASSTYARSGVNTLRLYNYQTTSTSASYGTAIAMLPEIEGDLDVMGMTFYARRSSTSATYSGFFDVGVVTDPSDPEGSFVPVQQHMIPANDVYQQMTVSFANYTGAPGRIAFRALKDYTESNTTSNYAYVNIYVDDITVEQVVFNKDIELVDVTPISDACDLSNARVKITVNNRNSAGTISAFTASYSVNGGATVTETVTPATPIAMGEQYTYTFTQAPALTEEVNNIEVVVSYPGDGNVNNNVMTLGPIHLITPVELPYAENFSNVVIGQGGWSQISGNNNNVVWTINNGTPTYTFNNTVDAAACLVSPCLNIPAGMYQISYDYNALDVLSENLNVFLATNIEDPTTWTLIGEHSNITRTAEATTATYNFNNAEDGIYYIIANAASLRGNMGVTFDNLSVSKLYNVNIVTGNHGTSTPNGNVLVCEGSDLNILILPEGGYHVASIALNGENVMGNDDFDGMVYNYTVANVVADATVNITFAPTSYTVVKTINPATPYGHFVPATNDVVAYGESDLIKVVADAHYHLSHLMISNVENVAGTDVIADVVANGNTYNYVINNVYTNKYINAIFRVDTVGIHYNVVAGNGTVDIYNVNDETTYPANFTHYVDYGSNYNVVFNAAPGYHVANITLNGVAQGPVTSWNFSGINGEQYFTVEFEKDVYTITTAAYGNGTVSEGETFAYDPAHEYVFTATPAVGNHIASITRNNVVMNVATPEVGYTDTLRNILSSYDYVAIFEPNVYVINAVAGNHGAITPAAATGYAYGDNANYTITADLGYYIASVTVDGETTNYTQADDMTTTTINFTNIVAPHTVSATFASYQYTITVAAAANGNITPGTSTYNFGTTPTFAITPAAGYGVADVTVDGESVGATTSYTFPSLTANHTIGATFAQYRYTITATAGNYGTITPAGTTSMIDGGNQTYTITPATGYHVADVYVDGASVGAVTTYNFNNVHANHSIYAEFEANEYTITVNQPANGTITPGTMTVAYGTTPTFVITPNTGYAVTAISGVANLNNVPSNNGVYTYTLPAVTANVTLTATMTMKTFTITATAGSHGTVTPAGASTVNYGATRTYTITPAAGYVIDNVTVDGMMVGAVSSYIFSNVTANHTINATFRMEDCNVPTNMQTINIDRNSATLVWYHPTATSFEVQYKAQDEATYTLVTVNNANTYDLSLLNAGTAYVWKVRALCSANNYSDWSNAVAFRTMDEPNVPNVGIEDYNESVRVYSHNNNVYISNEHGVQINDVQIFDIYGKVVYTGNVNSTSEVISMNVANGNYVVRLTTDKGVLNYKVYLTK